MGCGIGNRRNPQNLSFMNIEYISPAADIYSPAADFGPREVRKEPAEGENARRIQTLWLSSDVAAGRDQRVNEMGVGRLDEHAHDLGGVVGHAGHLVVVTAQRHAHAPVAACVKLAAAVIHLRMGAASRA